MKTIANVSLYEATKAEPRLFNYLSSLPPSHYASLQAQANLNILKFLNTVYFVSHKDRRFSSSPLREIIKDTVRQDMILKLESEEI